MVGYEATEGNSTIGKLQLITNLIQIYKIRMNKIDIIFNFVNVSWNKCNRCPNWITVFVAVMGDNRTGDK